MTPKIVGLCMVIGATSMGGFMAGDRVKNRYEQLRYLQNLICRLRSEIRYARSYLGEAFRQIGMSADEPYKGWLLDMCERMEERTGDTFARIWETKTREHLKDSGLAQGVLTRLACLGGQLGIMDGEQQIKVLDLYQEEIELAMKEMHEEMRTKIRLCHCLGVMSGIFITILLL